MAETLPFAYIREKVCKEKDAVISIQCKAVQYGQGCFTGIRGNWNENHKQLYLFRLEEHFKRFKESAHILGMNLTYDYDEFKELIMKLIEKNKAMGNIYVRPVLYSASTKLTPRFDNPDDDLAIYLLSLDNYFKGDGGLKTCVSSWRRIRDDVMSVKAKNTGAYATSALAKTEALRNGYDEPIYLDDQGLVCEASGANVFGIKDGEIWTPPLSRSILSGITRRTIIQLAQEELDLWVREEAFDRSMLYTFDELFFTGTAAKIAWIESVDQRKIGKGKEGEITQKLKNLIEKASIAELPGYEHWCTPAY
jgi:branched-chain amino acid aminotransferase